MGKKRNKKYNGLPADSVIGQIKSGEYKPAPSEITLDKIREMVSEIMDKTMGIISQVNKTNK